MCMHPRNARLYATNAHVGLQKHMYTLLGGVSVSLQYRHAGIAALM